MICSAHLVPSFARHSSHKRSVPAPKVPRNFLFASLAFAALMLSVISSSNEQLKHFTLAVTRNRACIAPRIIRSETASLTCRK